MGNLYETKDKKDRKYKNSQLQQDRTYYYHYDVEGNLIFKEHIKDVGYRPVFSGSELRDLGINPKSTGKGILYTWNANGSLRSVLGVDGIRYSFKYDAFGRRIEKRRMNSSIKFVWDDNVLLHEVLRKNTKDSEDKITTWVFESFVPTAKLVNGKAYSIISDHLGTPIMALDSEGNEVWTRLLDIYGRVKYEFKSSSLGDDIFPFVPFLYQGQYYDFETNLAYNRFRYYSPETGAYISQDPIRLNGNNPTLYAYVFDSNIQVDVFGLDIHHLIPNAVFRNNRELFKSIEGYIQNVSKKAQDKTNLLDLDKPFHGNHPKYNDYVEEEINNLKKGGLTLEKIKTLQDNLRNHIEKALENFKKTGITLNDYFKKGLHKIECKN